MQDVHQFGLGSLIDIDHFKFISKVTGGSVTTLPSLIISDGTAVRMISQDYSVFTLPYFQAADNDDADSVFSQRLSM